MKMQKNMKGYCKEREHRKRKRKGKLTERNKKLKTPKICLKILKRQ